MTSLRLTAIAAMLSAFPVAADDLVDRADSNGDGYVSLYELRAAYYADMAFNRRIEQSFAEYDTDGDGLISEAERRAHSSARAETTPAAGTAATASGQTVVTPSATPAPATTMRPASAPEGATQARTAPEVAPTPAAGSSEAVAVETAPQPASGSSTATATGIASTPAAATQATAAVQVAPTPAAASPQAAPVEVAVAPAAETGSVATPDTDTGTGSSGGGSAEVTPATNSAVTAPRQTRRLSRSEALIQRTDTDNSGSVSKSELVAGGDGEQWFPDGAFTRADKNGDGELDPGELEVLLQSMERWQRR